MPLSGYFVDANLFVLLVVSNTSRDIIAKHRRLRKYSERDFDVLTEYLSRVERVFATPNTLTETSNLLAQHAEPERSLLFNTLRRVIQNCVEIIVESNAASSRREFVRLGLSDAALLEVVSEETPLITVDVNLYLAVLEEGRNAALNFNHLRDL
ncbi:MAG: hypothetical protein F4Z35_03400 [Dehalococcoidia bacterium]|nr:hypothetical protein [Dehalococcoidia bacterium]